MFGLFTLDCDLSVAGGVKGGAVEDERRTRAVGEFADFGVEVVEEGVVVVEAGGHGQHYLNTENSEDCPMR